MSIPATLDYLSKFKSLNVLEREFYVSSFAEESKKLKVVRKTVQGIVDEKKKFVSVEQVIKFVFRVNLDKPIDEKSFLPCSMD